MSVGKGEEAVGGGVGGQGVELDAWNVLESVGECCLHVKRRAAPVDELSRFLSSSVVRGELRCN